MAARYLVSGGTGNWNSTTNWSATSGGASGASFPTVADDVIIDVASGNANIAINVASACLSLTIDNAHTGTMNFQNTLTVSGSITLGSGMSFSNTSGTALLHVNATGTLTSNGKTFPYNIQFGGATQTFTLADNWVVSGNFSQAAGNAGFINGNSLTIGGNLAVGANAISGTTTFVLNGTGTWSGGGVLKNNLTINTSGTITVSGTVNYQTGVLTYISGTVVTTGSTLSCTASTTFATSGITWNDVTIGGASQTFTLSSNLDISGTLSLSATTSATLTGNSINLSGSLISTTTGTTLGTTNIVLNGTGTWSNSSSGVLQNNLTINTSGTITISGSVRYTGGTLTYTSGTVVTTGSTIIIGGVAATSATLNTNGIIWNNVQWTTTGLTHNLTSDFTFSGSMIGGGSITVTFNTATNSKFICNSGTIALTGGTVVNGSTKLGIIGNSTWDGTNSGRFAIDVDVNCTTLNFIGGTVKWGSNGKTFKWVAGTPLGSFDFSIVLPGGILDFNGTTINKFVPTFNSTANRTISLASEMKVSEQFYLNSLTSTTSITEINSTSAGVQRKITLLQGCIIDVGPFINFTDITAEDGITIWAYKPTLSNTTNIRALPYQLSTIGTAN